MKEYAVKAETKKGEILILQRGFRTKAEAEDLTVRQSEWKRVWVDRISADGDLEACLPWHIEWGQGKRATYVVDAAGNRIATLMGSAGTRENFSNALSDLMSGYGRKARLAAE